MMAVLNIKVSSFLLTTWYLIQGATAINTVDSTPEHVNGQLLACAGDRISLTCSRNIEISSGVTQWTVSAPISCGTTIRHVAPVDIEPCDQFMFQNVTEVTGSQSASFLSSTAVAVANASMSGATVQCSTAELTQFSTQIGPNIILCIPDQLAPPEIIQVDLMANGTVQIVWNRPPGVCTARNISYDVNLSPTDGGAVEESIQLPITTTETSFVFNLTPGREYRAFLTANNTDCFISSIPVERRFTAMQNAVTVIESPTTSVTTGRTTTQQTHLASTGLPQSTIIIIIVVLIVVIIVILMVIGMIAWYFFYWRPKLLLKRANTTDVNMELHAKSSEVDALVYDDPNPKAVSHMKAASGDLYARPDKTDKISADSQGTYQDPTSIQHETAPTGDVYAVTEKKPKKKGLTEAELVQMYSVPDKSKSAGLTYASLDMPGGGGGSEVSRRPAPTEYASVVN